MNLKNLAMWGIIVLLSVGLFNMFQNPNKMATSKAEVPFSKFLSEVEEGRVIQVEIQGKEPIIFLIESLHDNTFVGQRLMLQTLILQQSTKRYSSLCRGGS